MGNSKFPLYIVFIILILIIVVFGFSVFSSGNQSKNVEFPTIFESSPSRGNDEALVQIIEFGDFQCPYCESLFHTFKKISAEYGDGVRLIWKDFPIVSIHKQALPAAEVARCAQEQGKFWEMHDKLFENQKRLSQELYFALAQDIGLDDNKFTSCLQTHKTYDMIEADLNEGVKVGVKGTPHFYINQYVFTELTTYDQIKEIIELFL